MNFYDFVQLDAELFNHRKIKQLRNLPEGDALVLFWIQLLCIAEKTQDDGQIYVTLNHPYSIHELAIEVGRSDEFVEKALQLFEEFQMISNEEELSIKNWEFYQNISKMD